ncbi:TPM domain-containing protein [Campylobacter rectus]|uniref:TPM domain-containing protein n=1 Tax=Campylobacter rectus TaxID=203 RepID=UPI000F5F350A|nr:TPM domain-containing protein [Campylobacter rectus]RRD53114.1 TPM domain-containing protein [Campylobacter rectus]
MKRILSALFCVFTLVLGLLAVNLSAADNAAEQNASAKETPSKESSKSPALTGRVVDQAGILSPAVKAELETALAAHENNTTNQVVVVTLESLNGANIEEYSLELGRRWGIGQKGKDNGVLLVVAPNDKQIRIEVGYGLEGILTDALSSNIINYYIIPEFKKGDIENGIKIGAQKIIALLEGDESAKKEIEAQADYEPLEAAALMTGIITLIASGFFGILAMRIGLSLLLSGIISLFVNLGFEISDLAGRFAVVLGLFALFFYLTRNMKAGGKGSRGSDYSGSSSSSSSGGGGRSSGGGFSGGGGSFGGGGASGRW